MWSAALRQSDVDGGWVPTRTPQSPLVLQLRRFQFLELVRTGRKQQALEHARFVRCPRFARTIALCVCGECRR